MYNKCHIYRYTLDLTFQIKNAKCQKGLVKLKYKQDLTLFFGIYSCPEDRDLRKINLPTSGKKKERKHPSHKISTAPENEHT